MIKNDHRKIKVAIFVVLLLLLCALFFWDVDLYHKSREGATSNSAGSRTPAPAIVQHLSPEEQWLHDHYPAVLTPTQFQSFYKTLIEGYSVPQTGLFLSFPRTADIRLVQQAATYDQGIIGILLLKLGDTKRVGRLLSFYETAWDSAIERSGPRQGIYGLANFYNAFFSVEGIEKTMHVGPNAWIGLLASRYARQTGDPHALELALKIAHWMIEKVPHTDGAIAMGQILWNSAPWDKIYSTENNLSTYAFLNDLLKNKTLTEADRHMIILEWIRIGAWLTQKGYQPQSQTVLRGFHLHGLDRAGAIDSYTWFIASLRPEYLETLGINPDALMHRAEKDFVVQVGKYKGVDAVDSTMADATYSDALQTHYKDVNFLRPAGDGHRLVWYEGTGQFIVALEDMARHAVHQAFLLPEGAERASLLLKASTWLAEAKTHTDAMDQAEVPTPWGTSYPCATTGRFYLYGWPAPEPLDGHLADASAPLVWRLFAGMGYEPLSDTQLGPTRNWRPGSFPWKSVRNPGTEILYGASEEMMVYAWKLYEKGDKAGAWRQAQATISLWEKDAQALQISKKEKVGTFLPFDGTVDSYQKIHDFWALNDVASCYFILAKIDDEKKNYAEASQFLSKILKEFYLAQMWDKRGWFWNPIDTIKDDYVEADPTHYGTLEAAIPDIPSLTVAQEQEYEAKHTSLVARTLPPTITGHSIPTTTSER